MILAIETSCDETAAAVYKTDAGLLSSVLFSQIELHQRYGGVVPEIASRMHIEKMPVIVHEALADANVLLSDIDVVAVTNHPGLPGSLLVGVSHAKALAYAAHKKLVAVNHIEAHIFSPFLEYQLPFPYLCLTASGGHTSIYFVQDFGQYQELGTTADDAAGEAFDKVAKLMELGYPGGPRIEQLAAQVGFQDFYRYPRLKHKNLQFSFSGLKTAVLYDLVNRGGYDLTQKRFLGQDNQRLQQEVASSFLVCVGDILVDRLARAWQENPTVNAVAFVGGVACNRYLGGRINEWASGVGLMSAIPARQFCTDNGAMVAFVGNYRAQQGLFADLTLDIW